MHKLPPEAYALILNMLCDGRSVRTTGWLTGSQARDADAALARLAARSP